MNLDNIDKKLLLILFKARYNLSAFTTFQRSKISFPNFTRSLHKLEQMKFLSILDNHITLTNEGIKHTLKLTNQLAEKNWRKVPENFSEIKIHPDSFYVPNIKLLDKSFTKNSLEVE